MKLFIPLTAKGESVSMPPQFWFFKLNFVWPLDKGSPSYDILFVNVLAVISLITYMGGICAEFSFIVAHTGEMIKVAECLCTTFVGTGSFIRIIRLIVCRHQMRDVLQEFYTQIYIHKSENATLNRICERRLRLLYLIKSMDILPLIFMFVGAAIFVPGHMNSRSKPYFYRMQFFYDAQEPWSYLFTSIYTGWVGISSVTVLVGEDVFIGTILCYCTMRYEMLHKELNELYDNSLKSVANKSHSQPQPNELHGLFINQLQDIIRKQQLIDKFGIHLQAFVSLTLLITILFGTFVLCTVAFELAKTDLSMDTFQYFFWLLSQSLQFLLLGSFGQRYTDAAAQMANSYYMCSWESLLPHGDAKANIQLLNDIRFAIYRSQKSVHLNGMQFLILSLNSIGSALSSSVSYFMFLNTMEDITSKENTNK